MIPETDARQAITLAGQGTSVAGIARRLGHDRKTIRTYLTGHRVPGQPRTRTDGYAPFAAYILQRASDDRHLRGTGLHREITALGYTGSYPAFTRDLRSHGIITGCGICRPRQPRKPPPSQHPPQLPAHVAPLTGETISSYLARLAAASHLPAANITGCLPAWFASRAAACDDLNGNSFPRPGDAVYLAALTGISENSLRHALPALALAYGSPRPPGRVTRSCRRCATRHGQHGPGPGPLPGTPPDLPTAPHLARPRHPDRHHHGPGNHRGQQTGHPPRPQPRHHQARARRGRRPPGDCRHAGHPAARHDARPGHPRPGPRASGHGRGGSIPGDDQDGGRAPHHAGRAARRAGITGKTPPAAPGGPTYLSRHQPHLCHLKRPAQVRGSDRADLSGTGQPRSSSRIRL